MKKILSLIILCFISTNVYADSKFFSSDSKNTPPDPIYNTGISVPQGYTLTVKLQEPILTVRTSSGDNINTVLNSDFYYKGQIIASEGSIVKGKIAKKDLDNGEKSQLVIKFTEMLTPEGKKIPISGVIKTDDETGIIYIDKKTNYVIDGEIPVIIKQPIIYFP